jgi:hypothetical protein
MLLVAAHQLRASLSFSFLRLRSKKKMVEGIGMS